jgi:hypothetical protein
MVALFVLVRPYLARQMGPGTQGALRVDVDAVLADGRQALKDRSPRRARDLFAEALHKLRAEPQGTEAPKYAELVQLHRQANLLARLMPVPLQDVLQHATQARDDSEWREEFADYRGRAVLFDDIVKRDSSKRPVLSTYVVRTQTAVARLALEELTLWGRVPLDRSPRALFGARLDRCEREEGGTWVFHFVPDSGTLLTEPAAVQFWLPVDDDLQRVLNEQRDWLGLEQD